MRTRKWAVVLSLLLAGILIGVVATSQLGWLPENHATETALASATAPAPLPSPADQDIAKSLNNVFTHIAQQVNPSVVTIFTDQVIKPRGRGQAPFAMDPFRQFFGEDFWRNFGLPDVPRGEQHLRGMGSGVIVSADGYILTNNHVVKNADKIKVMLMGGKKVDAKVVGTDPKTDVAVIKIKEKNLPVIKLGDSDKLRVGEWVVAIGSPLSENLAHTVTAGIVSAKGRSNVGLAAYEDFIQTDAAINPGNSGGALCNLNGELIGINTAIATETGGFQGIGFAVPINMARQVMDALIKHGKVVRGWLGVVIQNVNESLAKGLGLNVSEGVVISDVTPDSPAERAGLKVQDVILKFDGKNVKDTNFLSREVAAHAPGSKVTLTIYRDGKEMEIEVTLGELPQEEQATPAMKRNIYDKLGFKVETLTERMASQLGFDPNAKGVVVTEISQGSNAFAAGLRQGMLITQVNKKRVANAKEFARAISGIKSGEAVVLYASSQGRNFFIAFEMP